MRSALPFLLLLATLAAPVQGQTCKRAPPPFLPGLFPETAMGLTLQFATDPTGGCTGMYRPESASARGSRPWAMLTIEVNADTTLGEDPAAVGRKFPPPTWTAHTVSAWPVMMRQAPLGDEFVAIKGSVRVVVLVKNGDQGEASRALASAILEKVLPKVPCG